ncbi:MAG: MBL fold metallo-hydrolase [Bacteriovoracaceae bacterium]|nr:MBL fold metallo-hydrolase [Bacteriovoracaceae bacterium]
MNKHNLRLKFLGAAREVTGSKTQVNYKNLSFLVDCGTYQGPKELRQLNREELPHADRYDGVILTHAHIDHSGYLPKIVQNGFRGPIYCTAATAALTKILLIDAAHIEEEDAAYANRKGHSSHHPAIPLFTLEDVEQTIKLFKIIKRDEWMELGAGLSVKLLRSGHILGSSFVQFSFDTGNGQKILTFSGDLGSDRSPIIKGPVNILESDYLVLEATYGDKVHHAEKLEKQLTDVIHKVMSREGVLVIPAFAVGRTQEILYYIHKLLKNKQIPPLPVFVDSPMALKATEIYRNYKEELKIVEGEEGFETSLEDPEFHAVSTPEASRALNLKSGPMIIISAAGMLSGGRILHHLKQRLPDKKNILLFAGFQASGTKGRLLQNGIDRIRIHHENIEVKAEVETLEGISAHADSKETVVWLSHFQRLPRHIFLNHGENQALKALKYRLQNELAITNVDIPYLGEEFVLE